MEAIGEMAGEEGMEKIGEAYPMKGGGGPDSYSNNSYYQRAVLNAAKQILTEAIVEKLDILKFSPSNTIRVADLGCSVGPNTFFAVQNILEAIDLKCQNQGLNFQTMEFQVFFNDHTSNDFNTLFSSLPPTRPYHAAGVPGSFHHRLFPSASLHIVHLSYAIHWLSGVPKSVVDKSSPAWNKGRIHHSNAADEVVKAYSAHYAKDMARFLQARAAEVAAGGLMILISPGRPNGIPHSQLANNVVLEMLGSCLIDMVKKGIVSEEKVDLFNIPVYYMSSQELEEAIHRNGCFSIERMEIFPRITASPSFTTHVKALDAMVASHTRAIMEGLIKEHFGDEILDQLFDLYSKKLEEEYCLIESGESGNLLAVLKRKTME